MSGFGLPYVRKSTSMFLFYPYCFRTTNNGCAECHDAVYPYIGACWLCSRVVDSQTFEAIANSSSFRRRSNAMLARLSVCPVSIQVNRPVVNTVSIFHDLDFIVVNSIAAPLVQIAKQKSDSGQSSIAKLNPPQLYLRHNAY